MGEKYCVRWKNRDIFEKMCGFVEGVSIINVERQVFWYSIVPEILYIFNLILCYADRFNGKVSIFLGNYLETSYMRLKF